MPTAIEIAEYRPIMDFFTRTVDQHFNLDAASPIKMLEIGCGPGALTTVIKKHYKDKITITAIDPSDTSIVTAKKETTEDIDFQVSGIFDWNNDVKYDLIFFSKSLHHCVPVDKAVQIAHSLMTDNGIIISEEVFPDDVNPASISWFFDRLDLIKKCGLVKHRHKHEGSHYDWEANLLNEKLSHEDRWIKFGHSDCATSAKVRNAIHAEFGESKVKFDRAIPFYFHFLVLAGLVDTDEGLSALKEFISQEERAIKEGAITALGGNYVIYK
ncbi:S-adenosyl-L-methionine-dependent methyltransferase [Backusella circina FSU 941]|nr:S-adenosyl-L-methionine-dependent methyltransferase [Backusella circina FSU 941]